MGPKRQTPKGWRYVLSPAWFSFLYGFDLGLGVATRIYFASLIGTIVAIAIARDPIVGTMLGAIFGASRATTIIVLSRHPSLEASRPEILIAGSRRGASLLSGSALALFAVAIVGGRVL